MVAQPGRQSYRRPLLGLAPVDIGNEFGENMIAGTFSVNCLVFLLVVPVAADSYQIRVACNKNLRASHSLASAILASAPRLSLAGPSNG